MIFVFCALCGYQPRLVELPQALLIAAHVVLATALDAETEACARLAERAGAPVTADLIRDGTRRRARGAEERDYEPAATPEALA